MSASEGWECDRCTHIVGHETEMGTRNGKGVTTVVVCDLCGWVDEGDNPFTDRLTI